MSKIQATDIEGITPGRGEVCWDHYRIAYQVAVSGSLNKAARSLGTSHATVLRDLNRLEERLNLKLFLRHQRGYKLSDAGRALLDHLPEIQNRFRQLDEAIAAAANDTSGKLVITCLPDHIDLITPAIKTMRRQFPEVRVQLLTTDKIIPLASGLAHVAVRAGKQPEEADLVVRSLLHYKMRLYASRGYVEEHGLPESADDFQYHDWVLPSAEKQHIGIVRAVTTRVPSARVALQSNHLMDLFSAVRAGIGIGLVSDREAENDPDLIPLSEKLLEDTGQEKLWFIYHKDYIGNAKVEALKQCLLGR